MGETKVRMLKLTMLALVAVCMLAANGFAYTLPNGMTAYNSMGRSFVWDTWGPDGFPALPDGAFLHFDSNQNVTGYNPVPGIWRSTFLHGGWPDESLDELFYEY